MINDCPKCGKPPAFNGKYKCDNVKCSEHGESYFVWEWQKLGDLDELKTVQQKYIDDD